MLPGSYGNPGPRHRVAITVPAGPRRVVDGGEGGAFHVASGKRFQPAGGRRQASLRQCHNLLVVNLDFIGDWVLKTPFLRNLRDNAPRAQITALVLDRVYDFASTCPFVDRVISVSRAERRRAVFGAARVTTLAAFREDFLECRFDIAVVPRWDADFNGALHIAHGSRASHIVGFSEDSTPRKRQLNRGDDRFYTHAIVDRRLVHEADRDLALIAAMGGREVPARATVSFAAGDAIAADRFLEAAFGFAGRPVLAVAPFGSEARRTLPVEVLAGVVRRLAGQFDLAVVVVGGPRERADAEAFVAALDGMAVSAAGALATRASAALVARAAAFIGMDSGPAHIAAAVGTPAAVLSCHPANGDPGHASAPERFGPRGEAGRVLIVRPDRATAPCVDGCAADEAHCIRSLSEETLWPRLSRFVGSAVGLRTGPAVGDPPFGPGVPVPSPLAAAGMADLLEGALDE